MVETPGATRLLTASSTWRTICPLRRIFSTSACDLQLIMFGAVPPNRLLNQRKSLGGHVLHRKFAVQPSQTPFAAIVLHQRQRLLLVFFQALRDDFFLVVFALHQRSAAHITHAFSLGRLEVDVISRAVNGTR